MLISRSVLLRMRNVSDKCCRNTTHALCSIAFFENRAVFEKKWKNIIQPVTPQMTIWRTRISCWIPKAKNTHSAYVILLAFPLQKWLHERFSMLRCISCVIDRQGLQLKLVCTKRELKCPDSSVSGTRYFVKNSRCVILFIITFTFISHCFGL